MLPRTGSTCSIAFCCAASVAARPSAQTVTTISRRRIASEPRSDQPLAGAPGPLVVGPQLFHELRIHRLGAAGWRVVRQSIAQPQVLHERVLARQEVRDVPLLEPLEHR